MKAFKIFLFVLLLISLFVSFGCQSKQTGEMRNAYRVEQSDWRPTGTGFYTPVYRP